MWGGFPPPIKSKEEAVKMLTKDLPDFYFNHVKAWWPFRNEPNVLFVHYADMKRDVRAEIKRIANFLSIDVSPTTEGGGEAMLDAVVQKSSYDYMQTNSLKFMNNLGTKDKPLHIFKNASIHINKGEAGGATEFFNLEMKETWDDALSLHWADADPNMIEWAMNGGSIS